MIAGLALLLTGAAPQPDWSVAIQWRHPVQICAGFCIDYDLTMDARGRGVFRRRMFGDADWEARSFRVPRARAEAFRAALAPLRPGDDVRAVNCASDALDRPVVPLTVEWRGGPGGRRFESCVPRDEEREALRVLRFSPAHARLMTAREAEAVRGH